MTWLLVMLGVAILAVGYHYLRVSRREAGVQMVAEYEEVFGGCGICGYDRFSRREWGKTDRTPHFCREQGRWIE